MNPINYNMDLPNFFEDFAKSYQQARNLSNQFQADRQLADIRQNGATQQNLQSLMLADPSYANIAQSINNQIVAQAEGLMKTKKANDFQNEFNGLVQNPNAKYTDYVTLGLKYPEHKTEVTDIWKGVDAQQTKNMVMQLTPISALLKSGKEGLANDQLYQLQQAYENSGDTDRAEMVRQGRNLAASDPNAGAWIIDSMIAGAQDVKDVPAAMKTMQDIGFERDLQGNKVSKSQAETAKAWHDADTASYGGQQAQANIENTEENTRNVQSQISDRRARLGLDRQATQANIQNISSQIKERGNKYLLDDQKLKQLPEFTLKLINDSVNAATASEQSVKNYNDLADKLLAASGAKGVAGSGAEQYKKILGNQDAITQLKQEYVRFRSQEIIKSLPPGVASDKDIELAMQGFPPENASPEHLAGFLRGMAKLRQYEATHSYAKADWLTENGSLARAKKDMVIDGVDVKAGTGFNEFYKRKLAGIGRKNDDYAVDAHKNSNFMQYSGEQ
jgi:hypothetical protein